MLLLDQIFKFDQERRRSRYVAVWLLFFLKIPVGGETLARACLLACLLLIFE